MEPPGGTGGPEAPPDAERRPTPRWVAPVFIVVGLIVIVGVVLVFGSVGGDRNEADRPSDPAEVVEAYLAALQAGDDEEAYTYLVQSTWSVADKDEDAGLSRHVLGESNYIAHLRDGSAGAPRETGRNLFEVPATFTVGDRRIERTFSVGTDHDSDGVTVIFDGVIDIESRQFADSGLTVNGRAVPTSGFSLFPGTYVVSTASEFYELEGAGEPLLVVEASDAEQLDAFTPTVTAAAEESFRTMVLEQWRACVASTDYSTGCGLEPLTQTIEHPGQFVSGSIERTVSPEALDAVETAIMESPLVHPLDRTNVFTLDLPFDPGADLTTTVEVDDGQTRSRVEVPQVGRMKSPMVNFSRVVIQVTWE